MADFLLIGLALIMIFSLVVVVIKYILIPLFFFDSFPEKEALVYLKKNQMELYRYEKVKISLKEEFKEFPFYMVSYFDMEVVDKNSKKLKISVRKLKSGSLFLKNKIEFEIV